MQGALCFKDEGEHVRPSPSRQQQIDRFINATNHPPYVVQTLIQPRRSLPEPSLAQPQCVISRRISRRTKTPTSTILRPHRPNKISQKS